MTRTRQWTLGTAVVVLLILVGGWFLMVAPKHASADELRASTTTQESTNLTLQGQIATLKQQKAGLPAQEAKLATIRQHIPDNPALPSFIRTLSSLAKSSNVSLQTIAPVAPTANTSPAVTTTGTAPSGVVPQLQQVGITINLLGTYANVELFLNKLESLKRSFLVTALQVTPGTAGTSCVTSGSGSPSLAVIITARVFDVSTIGVSGAATGSTTGTPSGSTATPAN
jgi:Tfp pilus assembly protein PilO